MNDDTEQRPLKVSSSFVAGRAPPSWSPAIRVRLRTVNRCLRPLGFVLIVVDHDGQDAIDRGRTSFALEWIGLRWSRRRRAWDAKWIVDVPHIPELADD